MKKKYSPYKVKLTGLEANAILYGFDKYFDTDAKGKVHRTGPRGSNVGLTLEEIQILRDKLFTAHEHPE